MFEFLDRSGDGLLDYLEWTGLLSLDSFSDVALEDEKQRLVQKMVMQLAAKYGVQCLSPQVCGAVAGRFPTSSGAPTRQK